MWPIYGMLRLSWLRLGNYFHFFMQNMRYDAQIPQIDVIAPTVPTIMMSIIQYLSQPSLLPPPWLLEKEEEEEEPPLLKEGIALGDDITTVPSNGIKYSGVYSRHHVNISEGL
jgi:hypothetical protein